MAVPVITTDNSILSKKQGEVWERQFAATESPTSWTINAVPPGCTWNGTLGTLTGPCNTPGEYNLMVYAVNGSGTSQPLKVFLGVAASSVTALMSGPTIRVNVDSLAMTVQGLGATDLPYVKVGDEKLVWVVFERGDAALDLGELEALTLHLKSAQNDTNTLAVSTEVARFGTGVGTYYGIVLNLKGQGVRDALSDYDDETQYLYKPWFEIEVGQVNSVVGTLGPATLVWSTRSQQLILAADLGSTA